MYLRILLIFCFGLITYHCYSLNMEEIEFCYRRELWTILAENEETIQNKLENEPHNIFLYDVLEALAITQKDIEKQVEILETKVGILHGLEDAASLIDSYNNMVCDSQIIADQFRQLVGIKNA